MTLNVKGNLIAQQQLLNIAKAQRESKMQPNRLPDNIGGKSVPFERNRRHSP
jgi:hypothetical protein